MNTSSIILPENKVKTKNDTTLKTSAGSCIPHSSTGNVVKSKCKINTVSPKLPISPQKLTVLKATNPQLPSEQYINIFNRYQVF